VLEALAVYRATRLLQQDEVPPVARLRERLMQRYGTSPWSALLDCPWCLSVWLGGASVALRHLAPRFWRIGASVLASSAVAGVISEWLASLEPEEPQEIVKVVHAVPDQWPGRPSGAEQEAARLRDRLPKR
jgi:hypothetical protein